MLNSGLVGSMRTGFVASARPSWLLIAGLSVAVLVLGLLGSGRRARDTATRTAALFDDESAPVVPQRSSPTRTAFR